MDDTAYGKKQDEAMAGYESLCRRCGACCGAGGPEPCSNLKKAPSGGYYCASYRDRLGIQFTVSGNPFTCVTIRDVIPYGLPYENCGYAKKRGGGL